MATLTLTPAEPAANEPFTVTAVDHEPGDVVRIRMTNPQVRVYLGLYPIGADGTSTSAPVDLDAGRYKVYSEHQVNGRWSTIVSISLSVA